MIDFKLPSLGADMDEGTLLEWRIKPGDAVRRGQVIAVVDTAKAAVEVECWQEGDVFELLIEPGAKVPVGTPIASLLEAGESAATARRQVPRKPVVEPVAPAPGRPLETVAPASRPRVSPAARKRAGELGLDPAALTGTGPHGVITLEDVEAAGRAPAPTERGPTDRQAAMRQAAMRQAIGAAMSRSKREIPHYYLSQTIALGPAMAWLQTRNAGSTPEQRLLPSVLLLKAVALALREYPQLNGFWREGAFQPAADIHLGVAIALRQGGLIAPALHAVADKPLGQLMGELADLVQRARSGSLRSSELSDASLTVTQLGDQGVDTVFGVIYPPQVALVGFGSIAERPWVESGQLCVVPCVVASLAADHRVSDGHYGARFLGEVRRLLQNPDSL
ncbi:dihydrolipoamide acetyltransferase family protein [Pseudomonas borbori]|uniref:Dihydrolipoamide acetyltransferase component of pyruvate dehydrogenase complex n=1 Tax=Pseudomonas borbori TaxID=289003 RepID=A0A1I5NW92_9PSED|nr:dihydrolipoamide acetyltransferase family protein [Pseudomonas borbori]SFP26068.1 pyruvate dehydrogenase E2 component (dihydrolipoamide acetyltransferase) [Pseudomonas borbori]